MARRGVRAFSATPTSHRWLLRRARARISQNAAPDGCRGATRRLAFCAPPVSPLYLLVLILTAAVGAQWLASRLHVPGLLLLLAVGITLGPVTEVLNPEQVFGDLLQPIISLAAAVVLFEGGLSLHWREAQHVGPILWRLIISGLVLGFLSVTGLGLLLGLEPATAAVLGAILVVTGPTVIIPMLRGARIAFRPAALLKWEGIVNDPFGALLAIVALQIAVQLKGAAASAVFGVLVTYLGLSLAAAALGALFGWLLAKALDADAIREDLKSPVMLGAVLLVFALAELMHHEYGLLAVTTMGMVLANAQVASLENIRHFKEQVSTLMVGFLFVVLSARLELESLASLLGAPLVLVLAILFVARPLVVLAATAGSSLPWSERLLVGWIAPRGVVAAAVAGAFAPRLAEAGVADADLLVPIVFGVIIATVVLHGLSIRPLARRLGLASRPGNGMLLVGASTWAVALADAVARAGAFVVVTDTRYRRVTRARQEGLEVHFGDVLSEETALELPLERVSWLLAATVDDSYNALVTVNFAGEFDRGNLLQLTPPKPAGSAKGKDVPLHLSGVTPWGEAGEYNAIARRFWAGATFKVTQTTEQFDWRDLRGAEPRARCSSSTSRTASST